MQNRQWRFTCSSERELIMALCSGFESKWPEHCINHLWPHSNAMQQKCSGSQSEHLVLVLYDAILVMSANSAESNPLVLTIDLVKKTFMSECTVIGDSA